MAQQDHERYGSALSPRATSVNALFAALLAASAIVAVPLPGLAAPITLQVMIVVLIALILPPAWAGVSVGTYLLAGGIGLPVFARAHGGPGVLFGPTGGYLLGFLAGAVTGAWVRSALASRVSTVVADAAAALTVIVFVYLFGWLQLTFVSGMGPGAAFAGGVVAFIVPDALKAAVAVGIAPLVRRASRL